MLDASELWKTRAIDVAPVAIAAIDREGVIVAINQALTDILGYESDEIVGLSVETLIPQDARERHQAYRDEYAHAPKVRPMGIDMDLRACHRDGSLIPVEIGLSPFVVNGVHLVLATLSDITRRTRRLAALEHSEVRHRGVLDHAPDGFYMAHASGQLIEANLAYQRMSGYSGDELKGLVIHQLNAIETPEETQQRIATIVRDGGGRFETWHRRKDGSVWPVELTTSIVPGLDELFVFIRDVSERKHAEAEREALTQRIRAFAFTDALTGLPNRRLFMDRLGQALEATRRNAGFGAVLFIDMDRFKALNDTLGHAAGDKFLTEVAIRLSLNARREDTVARLGGDEFVVILIGLEGSPEVVSGHVRAYAEKAAARLSEPYVIDGALHLSSASIGATLFPRPNDTIDSVLHRADQEMYAVKMGGGSGFSLGS